MSSGDKDESCLYLGSTHVLFIWTQHMKSFFCCCLFVFFFKQKFKGLFEGHRLKRSPIHFSTVSFLPAGFDQGCGGKRIVKQKLEHTVIVSKSTMHPCERCSRYSNSSAPLPLCGPKMLFCLCVHTSCLCVLY